MIYGDTKTKQIARSVLPATRRRARQARHEKQQWNQTTRRRLDHDLKRGFHPGVTAEAAIDAWDENPSAWIDAYSPRERGDQRYIIRERRLADNLGPIRSWTRSQVSHFEDPADLIEDLARRLPDSLAGRHALGHMEDEFGPDGYDFRGRRREINQERAMRYAQWIQDIHLLVQLNLNELNRHIARENTTSFTCMARNRDYEKSLRPPPGVYYISPWTNCYTRVETERVVLDDQTCPKCGATIPNRNLRPLRGGQDIPAFIKALRPADNRELIAWMKERVKHERAFMAQPERIERLRALGSFLGIG